MGFPAGVSKITAFKVAANANYPTSSSEPINFDLSQCSEAWWDAVTDLSDIVVYDAVSDMLRPRYICPTASIVAKTGWGTCDSATSPLGRTLYLCVVPGAGAVNAAAAHTNSGCFSAHGYDVASGSVPDKTGAYIGAATAVTYGQAGIVCKSAQFAAANSRLTTVSAMSELSEAQGMTVQLLISKALIGSGLSVIFRLATSTSDFVNAYFNGNELLLQIRVGNVSSYTVVPNYTTLLSADTFALVSFIFNGTLSHGTVATQNALRAKIRINGSTISTTYSGADVPSALPVINTVTYLGYTTTGVVINIDESRIFDRALSDAEDNLAYKNLMDHANFATYSDYSLSLASTSYSFNMGMAYVY